MGIGERALRHGVVKAQGCAPKSAQAGQIAQGERATHRKQAAQPAGRAMRSYARVRHAMAAGLALSACAFPIAAVAEDLREALLEAYQTNPTLQAARAAQRATVENVPIQKSAGRPNASATVTHIEFVKQSSTSFTSPSRTLQASTALAVPIYSGGAVKNGVRAAEERVAAGQADLRGSESAVFAQVVAAYMDVIRAEAIVGLSASQVNVLRVNLEATSDRFEIGDLTRTDIAQSEARLALAESDFRSAESNLIAARETYIRLIGSPPQDLQAPPPLPGLPESARQATFIALEDNPDLIAARERAQAAKYDVSVASASRLPSVSLFVNGDYTNYYNSLGGSNPELFNQQETTANAGVRLSIPLYQGGRPAALRRQAQARQSASLEQLIGAERNVIAQVRAAFSSYRAALAIIQSSQKAVAAADLGLEGVRAENTVGNRTILDILNAEQELLSARVQLVTAHRNAYVAGFSLLAAMGHAEARDLGLDGTEEGLGVLYDPTKYYQEVEGDWWDWGNNATPQAISTRTVDIPPADAEIGPSGAVDAPAGD